MNGRHVAVNLYVCRSVCVNLLAGLSSRSGVRQTSQLNVNDTVKQPKQGGGQRGLYSSRTVWRERRCIVYMVKEVQDSDEPSVPKKRSRTEGRAGTSSSLCLCSRPEAE